MLGGTATWYAALKAGVPLAGVDRRRGVALLKTKRGNVVAAAQDEAGRLFLFDKAGNVYYDTEDPRVGMYIVDTSGEMFNEYVDLETGDVRQVYVGNLADLTSIPVAEVGGVPVAELQRSVRGFRGGRVVGFQKLPQGDAPGWEDLMPPNAPASAPRGGGRVAPPPMLEEMEVEVESAGGGGWFGGRAPPPGELDGAAVIQSLRRQE
jgi:hypothetical protein